MSIEEARTLKKQLEYKILLLITQFEQDANVTIDTVEFNKQSVDFGRATGGDITVSRELNVIVKL